MVSFISMSHKRIDAANCVLRLGDDDQKCVIEKAQRCFKGQFLTNDDTEEKEQSEDAKKPHRRAWLVLQRSLVRRSY